jgi:hypothetical protein
VLSLENCRVDGYYNYTDFLKKCVVTGTISGNDQSCVSEMTITNLWAPQPISAGESVSVK